MDGFTIFLLVFALVALVTTVYGLVRPRPGHRVDQNAMDGDQRHNTARLTHQVNTYRAQNDSGGFGGSGGP